jgi:NAD(P)-dependent dehydrogenase (short-subunit alcohol dehydrogenase family)
MQGKTAIVTGGASGIGEQIVRLLRARGAEVVFGDVSDDAGAAVASDTGATYVRTDVTSRDDLDALVSRASQADGGVDYAFFNAGILGRPFDEQINGTVWDPATADLDLYARTMAVNVDGVVQGVAAVIPAMRSRGTTGDGGGIVATASVAGLLPYSPDPFYVASKHAVVGFVRSVAINLRSDNITVNAICPGGVATPMTGMGNGLPIVMLEPSEVAEAQLDAATTDLTGQCFTIVGGKGVRQHDFNGVDGF